MSLLEHSSSFILFLLAHVGFNILNAAVQTFIACLDLSMAVLNTLHLAKILRQSHGLVPLELVPSLYTCHSLGLNLTSLLVSAV